MSGTNSGQFHFTENPMKIPIAIIGCGGMGKRHLFGIQELMQTSLCNVELVAVCDLRADNAEHLGDEAESLLGYRPAVFSTMERMRQEFPQLQAVIVTTDAGSHHKVVSAAFELGWHVLCEKPLGLTLRACNSILAAQAASGKTLSVAENYRRDPMSRLTRALLDAGAIGAPQMFLDISASSGSQIIITPWRHKKESGGMLLDGGVHNADMMLYYMGDVEEVYAQVALLEKTRYKPKDAGALSDYYNHWYAEMPDSIQATAEDTMLALLKFKNGTMGQWTQSYAAHGRGFGHKAIYGQKGSMIPGGTRNGVSPVLHLDNVGDSRQEPITGDALLELVPDYSLDPITSALFASERPTSYSVPFQAADRKLLAIEIHELADCVIHARTPEVDGLVGRRAVAMCYAAFESGLLNRPVSLDEIEAEEKDQFEHEINLQLELL